MFFRRARPILRNSLRLPQSSLQVQTTRRSSNDAKTSRVDRILNRLPPSLQKYTTALRRAPVSHVVAFLVLHEITAVVPLLALFALFHYTTIAPLDYVTDHWAAHVRDGAAKAERYFSRKGWFGFGPNENRDSENDDAARPLLTGRDAVDNHHDATLSDALAAGVHAGETYDTRKRGPKDEEAVTGGVVVTRTKDTPEAARETRDVLEQWRRDDVKYKVVVEVALAWAITKALLPARILVSVWGTPWFAGVMLRARNALRKR